MDLGLMLQTVERLVANPDRFSIVPSTIRFLCSPTYVGVYFGLVELATDIDMELTPLVCCHVTVYNGVAAPDALSANLTADRRMLRLASESQRVMRFFLTSRLPFAFAPPVVLNHRILRQIHVQGLFHVQLWALRSSALAMLGISPRSEHRDNFHLSVDRLFD